jgi:hypothetical protein
VLDGGAEIVLEQKLSTTPKVMKEVFGKMPLNRIELAIRLIGCIVRDATEARRTSKPFRLVSSAVKGDLSMPTPLQTG